MSEQIRGFRDTFTPGSLDSTCAMEESFGFIATEKTPGHMILRPSSGVDSKVVVTRNSIESDRSYLLPDGFRIPLPSGEIEKKKLNGENISHSLVLGPRLFDDETKDKINSVLKGFDKQEKADEFLDSIFNMYSCTLDKKNGVTLSFRKQAFFEMKNEGSCSSLDCFRPAPKNVINNTWEFTIGAMTEGGTFFEACVDEVNCDINQSQSDFLLIAGVKYGMSRAQQMNSSLNALIERDWVSNGTVRQIIDPYIRLVEVN